MPAGVTGLRASGKLTRDDGLEWGAVPEDLKTGFRAWFRDHESWHRMAFVTDVEWIARATRAFAGVAPGELEVFPLAGEDAARDWVAG